MYKRQNQHSYFRSGCPNRLQKAVVAKEEEKFLIILFDQRDAYSANVIKNGQTDILEAFFELKNTGRDLKIKIEYLVKDQDETYNTNQNVEKIKKVFRGEIVKDIAHGN